MSLSHCCFFPVVATSEDVSIPQPFQVTFSGPQSSVGCISIPVISDSDAEGDEFFTVSIAMAGSQPHARILSPSVATITIQDNTTSMSESNTLESMYYTLESIYWSAGILAGCCITVGLVGCILGALLHWCCSRHSCCMRKTPINDIPMHCSASHNDFMTIENAPFIMTTNETYSAVGNMATTFGTHQATNTAAVEMEMSQNECYMSSDQMATGRSYSESLYDRPQYLRPDEIASVPPASPSQTHTRLLAGPSPPSAGGDQPPVVVDGSDAYLQVIP